jgi:MFS family permease
VGFVSLAYSGVASVSQPFFGWLADRYGTRFIGLALIWTASTFSTIGFAASFPTLVALAALAGLGSGMYHPLGAMSARRVIDERQRNTAMSIYVTAGTVGVSLGPLIGALVFSWLGLHGTVVMFVPGICTATWLLFELRRADGRRPIHAVTRCRATGAASTADRRDRGHDVTQLHPDQYRGFCPYLVQAAWLWTPILWRAGHHRDPGQCRGDGWLWLVRRPLWPARRDYDYPGADHSLRASLRTIHRSGGLSDR